MVGKKPKLSEQKGKVIKFPSQKRKETMGQPLTSGENAKIMRDIDNSLNKAERAYRAAKEVWDTTKGKDMETYKRLIQQAQVAVKNAENLLTKHNIDGKNALWTRLEATKDLAEEKLHAA